MLGPDGSSAIRSEFRYVVANRNKNYTTSCIGYIFQF